MKAFMNEKKQTPLATTLTSFLQFVAKQPKGSVYHEQTANSKEEKLVALFSNYKNCTKCPLGTQGRNNVVFGAGNPNATLMFVGEGPGRDEDIAALPFVGRAGQLLTKIIESMGLARSEVYITNTVKCRPPQNRVPLPIEIATCTQLLLFKEIEIVQPRIICTLGATATSALFGEQTTLSPVRGKFKEAGPYLVIPTYHPAYLLRNPEAKKTVWEDMKKIMTKLTDLT